MAEEQRFSGRLAEEYDLLKLAYPEFEKFQAVVGRIIAQHDPPEGDRELRAVEIGAGNGFTTRIALDARKDLTIDAVDNEPAMIRQLETNLSDAGEEGRLRLAEEDALEYLRVADAGAWDILFSAFTFHNFVVDYRSRLLHEVYRVLKPGGLFINADKYAPDGQAQFDALITQLERFFDAFVPLGKYDLLRDWVTHNVADQSPERCQRESSSLAELESIGFQDVQSGRRTNMEAIVTARKPEGEGP